MTVDDTLCFADFDPVTGAPFVDGFTGIHDDLVFTSEADSGYVLGTRLTFGTGSGFPPVIFQGVKNGNFLNLAFFSRFDLTFNDQDVVVIALRPSRANTSQATARRMDIFPLWDAVGADETGGTGGPAGDPDSSPPGVPVGANYHIRTDHHARSVVHYRGSSAGNPWTTTNPPPANTTYSPTNITIKTRSWQPPVPTLTTSVGTQTLGAGSTFNVVDTASFPPRGVFSVGGFIIQYTAKTSTSFTGCSGGTGTIPSGSGVSIPEAAWSVEVQLPLTTAALGGGADWIDIQDSFGLYFAVVRVGRTPASGTNPSQGFFAAQSLFPVGTSNFLTGNLDETTNITPSWYGTGLIPALQVPAGSNLGLGVSFANGELGLGVRNATAAAGSALGTQIRGASSAVAGDNRLVAQVKNTGPQPAANVGVEFRFANWGLGPPTFPAWALASGATRDYPATGISVPAGGATTELTWTWPKASVPTAYAPPKDHQCCWAQLTSTSAVNFTQSSVRRNLDFVNLSEVERPATISGVGYPAPASGNHDFLLMTQVRKLEVKTQGDGRLTHLVRPTAEPGGKVAVYWLWIATGFRRTGQTMTIGARTFEILDERPGAFGLLAQHDNASDVFTHELSGGGIENQGGGLYSLKVPHNGSVTIKTRLAAGPPDPCASKPGDSWWVRLFKWLCRFIRRLFQRPTGSP